jgi:hypothetical protein
MKPTEKTMKQSLWKRMRMAAFALTLATAPLLAQDNAGTAPPEPPAPQAPHASPVSSNIDDSHNPPPVRLAKHFTPIPIFNPRGEVPAIPIEAVVITLISIGIPFTFFTVVISLAIYFKYRRNRVLHETIRMMIEKGVPIPPELIVPPIRTNQFMLRDDLLIGLVLCAAGAGITIFLGRLGMIVLFVGIAFLIVWFVEKKNKNKNIGQPNP